MPRRLFAATLFGTFTAAAPGLAGTETLREALGQLPEVILANPAGELAYFLDMEELLALPQPEDGTPQIARGMEMAGGLPPMQALATAGPGPWEEKAGIGLESLRYLAGFGASPHGISIWGLEEETSAALPGILTERGFAPAAGDVPDGALANGEPMQTDLTMADAADPWRGRMGQASLVALRDTVLIQSPTPEGLAAVAQPEPPASAADHAIVRTILDGIDAAAEGPIVQAMLISPAFGLPQIDPAVLLQAGRDGIDRVRAVMEAQVAAGSEGIPVYLGGLIADIQTGQHPALVIALAYPDCDIAEAAGAALVQRWQQHPGDALPAETRWQAVPATEGFCAATVTIMSQTEGASLNPIAARLLAAYRSRDFNLLQIGSES